MRETENERERKGEKRERGGSERVGETEREEVRVLNGTIENTEERRREK